MQKTSLRRLVTGRVHEGLNRGTTPVKAIATFIVEKGKPMTTQVQ